jgi:choice-of-anchor A domain-containing protein
VICYTPLKGDTTRPARYLGRIAMVLLVFAGSRAAQASPMTLGQASAFDVFLFGNFTESGTDSQGAMAVGGNFAPANNGGFSIASQLSDPAGVYDLVVGGNFTNNGYSMGGGDAFVGGNMTWTDPTLPHNAYVDGNFINSANGGSVGGKVYYGGSSCTSGDPITCKSVAAPANPIDFAGAQANLDNVSTTLASETANGTTSFNGYSTYTLTGSSSTLNVFNLTNGTYNGATINITAPASSTVVINVAGTSDSFSGGSINLNGVSANDVIFNFSAATSVSIANISWEGTLLAPMASFSGTWGQLNGELIAESASGTTEFHDILFSGTLPAAFSGSSQNGGGATPEPATWMVLLGGGVLIGLSRRRASCRR